MLKVKCGHCKKKFEITDHQFGLLLTGRLTIECPHCKKKLSKIEDKKNKKGG